MAVHVIRHEYGRFTPHMSMCVRVCVCSLVGRSSKRLRGEQVDKLSFFDNPELAARRYRQAVHANPASSANPEANPSRHSRAVHFQEPSAQGGSPEAMQVAEAEEDQGRSHQQQHDDMDHDNGTPHGTVPDSVASGLTLTLSAASITAQPPDSAQPESNSARISNVAAPHAVPAELGSIDKAANTAGRAVVSSQDSLRLAAERAMAIASTATRPAGDADVGDGADDVNMEGACNGANLHSTGVPGTADISSAVHGKEQAHASSLNADKAPGELHASSAAGKPGGGPNESQHAVEQHAFWPQAREEEAQRNANSTVLANTTRPNVLQSKSIPLHKKAHPGAMLDEQVGILHSAHHAVITAITVMTSLLMCAHCHGHTCCFAAVTSTAG